MKSYQHGTFLLEVPRYKHENHFQLHLKNNLVK